MVVNKYIECNICKTKFRLRWQIGYYMASVQIRCPQCNSRIYGYLSTNENSSVNLHGAVETTERNTDYVQEISTEFITHKLCKNNEFPEYLTPFMRNTDVNFDGAFLYLNFVERHPNEVEVINDLLNAKSRRFLKEKLRDDNNEFINICKTKIKNYKLNSEVDLLMASHQYLMTTLSVSGVYKDVLTIMNEIKDLRKTNEEQVKQFSKLLDNKGYYKALNSKFPKLVNIYNANYLSLISVISLYDFSGIDKQQFGLSSVDYEDLLDLYRKCYEFIGEYIIYVIGLNNIYERSCFNQFKNGCDDIETKVNREDKFNRIQCFVKNDEHFSNGFCDTLNKIVRNSEAHFDVEYDIMNQEITFISKGKNNTYIEKMFLLDFANETVKIFNLSVKLWEIAYQLQKLRLACDLHSKLNYG